MPKQRAYVPRKEDIAREKARHTACKLYCGNIRGYRQEIKIWQKARDERIDAFNGYLSAIGKEVDQDISYAKRDIAEAIGGIAMTRNIRSAIDAAASVAKAVDSINKITAQNSEYRSNINRLRRRLNESFRKIGNYEEDLSRTAKLAHQNSCSCVR